MKSRAVLLTILVLTGSVFPATAEEQVMSFVDGLRNRGYFDTAVEYLGQLESKANLADDVKQQIPFQRAVTLLQWSRRIQNTDERNTTLEQAQASLELFVKQSPQHPLAARANSERANIYFERARTLTWESQSPSNASRKGELQDEARQTINRARKIFQAAHDQFKASWESFPTYIDAKEAEQINARREAETGYMQAQLYLARCTYEEGQSYDVGSDKRREILTRASTEFEDIHSKYRLQVAGLYARMMQGKCFEEQDDITKAVGIYNELLSHPGKTPALLSLKDQVLRFRLICLNHEKKQDYQLVVQEANDWLVSSGQRSRSEVGLGIRWEKALAEEQLGQSREFPDAQRERYLRQAIDDAQQINRYVGQFKDVSTSLIRRVKALMGQGEKDLEDFDTAYEIARGMVKQIKQFKTEISAARDKATQQQKQAELDAHINETMRMLNLALANVDSGTDTSSVMQARYLLSFMYYEKKLSFESVILARYIMRHSAKDDPETALNASEIALAACVQAYNAAPRNSNDLEIRLLEDVSNALVTGWPESDRSNEARMTLGMLYSQRKQPVDAARWYTGVPQNSPRYGEAQMAAGQAFWTAYLEAALLKEGDPGRPAPDELVSWQALAENHLRVGLEQAILALPAAAAASSEYTAAQVTMCQILNNKGQFEQTITMVTAGDHPVLQAISVPDENSRSADGVTSSRFAGYVYQLLLRAYVGTQKIDEALAAMADLEKIGGGGEATTAIYVELGKELESEIKRLKGSGDTDRLTQVRTSFESFLNEVFNKQEGRTYNTLIWVAETYYGLGQGMDDDRAAADQYFTRAAATYQEILDNNLAETSNATGVRVRLIDCKRQRHEYQAALQLAVSVLEPQPKLLPAQFEAARVLQDWGNDGEPDRLLEAILGQPNPAGGEQILMGFGNLAKLLGNLISMGRSTPDIEERRIEAQYASVECRRQYGNLKGGTERTEALEAAQLEINSFISIAGELSDDWWDRFDKLYQDVQQDLGIIPPSPLEKPKAYEAQPVDPVAIAAARRLAAEAAAAEAQAVAANPPPPPKESNVLLLGLAVVVALGAAGGVLFMMSKPTKRPQLATATSATAPAFQGSIAAFDDGPPSFDNIAIGGRSATPKASPRRQSAAKPTPPPSATPTAKSTRPPTKPTASPDRQPAEATKAVTVGHSKADVAAVAAKQAVLAARAAKIAAESGDPVAAKKAALLAAKKRAIAKAAAAAAQATTTSAAEAVDSERDKAIAERKAAARAAQAKALAADPEALARAKARAKAAAAAGETDPAKLEAMKRARAKAVAAKKAAAADQAAGKPAAPDAANAATRKIRKRPPEA